MGDWVNGKARERRGVIGNIQRQSRSWFGSEADMKATANDWTVHIFREHNREADAWAAKGPEEK